LNIELLTNATLEQLTGDPGRFTARIHQKPRYVNIDKCTSCGDCAEVCPVILPNEYDLGLSTRKATSQKYGQAIPGAFAIEKADTPPCRLSCPAGLNVQGYVQMVRQGKYKEALEIIMQDLPLPGVLGRICTRGCENSCRRMEVDQPIAIRSLKRLAADQFDPREVEIPCEPRRDERVAIIGSGPAGLSAAYHLARRGIHSTIFEAQDKPGGMLRSGIPEHRLPRDVLDQEIELITNLGVEIKTSTPLGADLSVDDLYAQGFQAVYLALGAQKGISLGIPGEKSQGVRQGIDFLREVNLSGQAVVGNTVAIIGGGNVAVDVARCALRLGAKEVHILYRRTRAEMPALEEEIEAAEEEGVRITYLTAPQEILAQDGRVTGLRCIRMELGEADSSGRRRPVPIPGSEFELTIDQIFPAIGQQPDLDALNDIDGLEFSRWGTTEVDPVTYATGRPGLFAGGDLQTGPWVAIGAVAAGREAAESIVRYIEGRDLAAGRDVQFDPENPVYRPIPPGEPRTPRAAMPELPLDKRTSGFQEVELGFDEQAGRDEAERCLNCAYCCDCFQCVEACQAGAIEHEQQARDLELEVGSVILCPGTDGFDPTGMEEFYAYRQHPNVMTSLEFERILSASGPTMGHLVRLSDQREPKKIAWLQCVGSRDTNHCANGYCSSVCCMYAIKEAMIAKEHSSEALDCAIFNMDIRTFGKDYEKYYDRARQEQGVRFIKSRVHTIDPIPGSDDLLLKYTDEAGQMQQETFDLVILSIGLQPSPSAIETARRIDLDLDHYQFIQAESFTPVHTSREGVFASGTFLGPKDIPASVAEAGAAACQASIFLSDSRGSLVQEKTFPREKEVSDEEVRIGVFVCNCGSNIGGIANVPDIVEFARDLPNVRHVEENQFSCSQDTQNNIAQTIQELGLNRVVVAACTPRTHEPLFQETIRETGLNPYLFEMANIRNQCTWVHSKEKDAATLKAKDLVRMSVARANLLQPLEQPTIGVNNTALVVGGGLSGMTAALSLADQGFATTLVESTPELGGQALKLITTWDGIPVQQQLRDMIQRVRNHPSIDLRTEASITDAKGFVGNFNTTITSGDTEDTIEHGALILAVGAEEHKPAEYLYGQDDRVLTHLDLDARMADADQGLDKVRSAVFIQCVGSREPDRPYCSKICCTHSIKSALHLKQTNPEMNVMIIYRDIRTYGEREDLYQEARRKGIIFIRYEPERKPEVTAGEDALTVSVRDHILDQTIEIEADLLVLASAVVPRDNELLAQLYKLSLNEDKFFMEAHPKLRPVEFATEGIFLAGIAHYPKPIEESIAQAQAAASKAAVVLSRKEISVEGVISHINEVFCRGCGECVQACPYNAVDLTQKEFADKIRTVAFVQAALCKGCGACAAACPTGAASVHHFEDDKVMSMVTAALA
jgi:heterodisulfide reductase subunit A-like polyferredoxin